MTREEEFTNACIDFKNESLPEGADISYAFFRGAIWADSHPKWISVKDRLPLDSGKYLIYEKRGFVRQAYFAQDTKSWNDRKAFFIPTHWMPLPAPPKKGGEE